MSGGTGLKQKILAIDCLKVMKQGVTFRDLSKQLKIPSGLLNRYINGDVLPKPDRAKHILSHFTRYGFNKSITKLSRLGDGKYIVTGEILSQPFMLRIIASKCYDVFPVKVDAVLSAAVDGIPLALITGDYYGAKALYAKKTQEIAFSDHYVSKGEMDKPLVSPFYLPKNMLGKGDKVLIVDDVIRGGSTSHALLSICQQAKAEIVGIFSIFATREALEKLGKENNIKTLFVIQG